MNSEISKKIIDFIEKNWHKRISLFISLIFVAVILFFVFQQFDFSKITLPQIIVVCIVLLVIVIIWVYSNRIPRAPKGKIGFALAIVVDDPAQQKKITSDFEVTLRELLYSKKCKYPYAFIKIPNHIANQINPKTAQKYLFDFNCRFMIFGRARTAIKKGELQHVLHLEGIVYHKKISEDISKNLSSEFTELFPRKLVISSDGDLFHFEFTAQWVDLVAQYIIGIAALVSGDVDYSRDLFENLSAVISRSPINVPAINKIRQRIPSRLATIYLLQSKICYHKWKKSRDDLSLMSELAKSLEKLESVERDNIDLRNLKAICYVVLDRDSGRAKCEILKINKSQRIPEWRLNYAFLLAYEGNLHKALKEYRDIAKKQFGNAELISEITSFIKWLLKKEPEKIQFYFSLGVINYLIKKDYPEAIENFEKFIEAGAANQFSNEVVLAENFLWELDKLGYTKPKKRFSLFNL